MMHKAWCSIEEVPYYFSRSSIKFQGHTGWKINDLDQIWARLLISWLQLSNPSALPCFWPCHFTFCCRDQISEKKKEKDRKCYADMSDDSTQLQATCFPPIQTTVFAVIIWNSKWKASFNESITKISCSGQPCIDILWYCRLLSAMILGNCITVNSLM